MSTLEGALIDTLVRFLEGNTFDDSNISDLKETLKKQLTDSNVSVEEKQRLDATLDAYLKPPPQRSFISSVRQPILTQPSPLLRTEPKKEEESYWSIPSFPAWARPTDPISATSPVDIALPITLERMAFNTFRIKFFTPPSFFGDDTKKNIDINLAFHTNMEENIEKATAYYTLIFSILNALMPLDVSTEQAPPLYKLASSGLSTDTFINFANATNNINEPNVTILREMALILKWPFTSDISNNSLHVEIQKWYNTIIDKKHMTKFENIVARLIETKSATVKRESHSLPWNVLYDVMAYISFDFFKNATSPTDAKKIKTLQSYLIATQGAKYDVFVTSIYTALLPFVEREGNAEILKNYKTAPRELVDIIKNVATIASPLGTAISSAPVTPRYVPSTSGKEPTSKDLAAIQIVKSIIAVGQQFGFFPGLSWEMVISEDFKIIVNDQKDTPSSTMLNLYHLMMLEEKYQLTDTFAISTVDLSKFVKKLQNLFTVNSIARYNLSVVAPRSAQLGVGIIATIRMSLQNLLSQPNAYNVLTEWLKQEVLDILTLNLVDISSNPMFYTQLKNVGTELQNNNDSDLKALGAFMSSYATSPDVVILLLQIVQFSKSPDRNYDDKGLGEFVTLAMKYFSPKVSNDITVLENYFIPFYDENAASATKTMRDRYIKLCDAVKELYNRTYTITDEILKKILDQGWLIDIISIPLRIAANNDISKKPLDNTPQVRELITYAKSHLAIDVQSPPADKQAEVNTWSDDPINQDTFKALVRLSSLLKRVPLALKHWRWLDINSYIENSKDTQTIDADLEYLQRIFSSNDAIINSGVGAVLQILKYHIYRGFFLNDESPIWGIFDVPQSLQLQSLQIDEIILWINTFFVVPDDSIDDYDARRNEFISVVRSVEMLYSLPLPIEIETIPRWIDLNMEKIEMQLKTLTQFFQQVLKNLSNTIYKKFGDDGFTLFDAPTLVWIQQWIVIEQATKSTTTKEKAPIKKPSSLVPLLLSPLQARTSVADDFTKKYNELIESLKQFATAQEVKVVYHDENKLQNEQLISPISLANFLTYISKEKLRIPSPEKTLKEAIILIDVIMQGSPKYWDQIPFIDYFGGNSTTAMVPLSLRTLIALPLTKSTKFPIALKTTIMELIIRLVGGSTIDNISTRKEMLLFIKQYTNALSLQDVDAWVQKIILDRELSIYLKPGVSFGRSAQWKGLDLKPSVGEIFSSRSLGKGSSAPQFTSHSFIGDPMESSSTAAEQTTERQEEDGFDFKTASPLEIIAEAKFQMDRAATKKIIDRLTTYKKEMLTREQTAEALAASSSPLLSMDSPPTSSTPSPLAEEEKKSSSPPAPIPTEEEKEGPVTPVSTPVAAAFSEWFLPEVKAKKV